MKKIVTTLLLALVAISAQAQGKLHLYNWNNYISDETVRRFETACKCQLVQSYYGDNEEMLAKLAAGAKGYDLIVPTGNALQSLIRQGALQPLDKSKLPNLKNLNPQYLNTEFDKGNQYSVPYAYTITMLGYNEQKMKELGIKVDSWAAIFDPAILAKIKGKVTVLDSANELMAAALKYLGYSINDTDEKHWEEAKNMILKAKPYWAAFNGTSYIKGLTVGDIWLVHGYSSDIFQADLDAQSAGRKFRIRHALPKEGAAMSLDSLVIPKDAPRPDLAHLFINLVLDGKNSAELTNMLGTGNPNKAALPFINPEIAGNREIFPDKAESAKLEMLKDLNSKQRRALNRVWTEIRVR
ncbi:MAG: spermidine/putrescine ABC transporter substrate-binding protein [Burkholderiaceae bacterium]|uniref:Putrescine-binding periplasmic protein n=1 Tax=Herminiimonas contaminans TaxID=1111140 RepID=A0ABS0ETG3_9BURK|nr:MULTISPECIES: spermidine/putrescine ABC transporter substrate-binding protein [Oxalobacteraceae]MBF8176473.1 spermidine/putrescine ABC transporter substrate-binding protein [Herminiimonas contaminans]MBX9798332.1 spermidine/putrescine ABC transporter substrate-binding protein [Burkholderiaceae bacterium]